MQRSHEVGANPGSESFPNRANSATSALAANGHTEAAGSPRPLRLSLRAVVAFGVGTRAAP
jgi:hypothetical protein